MTSAKNSGGKKPRKKFGFLLTLTLIWLCFQTLSQLLDLVIGIVALLAVLRGETSFPGVMLFLFSTAVFAVYLLSILFLLRGNRRFYLTFAIGLLIPLLSKLIMDNFDPASLAAFFIVLPFVAGYWVLLFVLDRPRKHFGLPILHPKKTGDHKAAE